MDPEQCWRLNIKVKEVFWANQPFYVNDSVVPFKVKPVVGKYHVFVESSVFEVSIFSIRRIQASNNRSKI